MAAFKKNQKTLIYILLVSGQKVIFKKIADKIGIWPVCPADYRLAFAAFFNFLASFFSFADFNAFFFASFFMSCDLLIVESSLFR